MRTDANGHRLYKCPRCCDTGWVFQSDADREVHRCSRCYPLDQPRDFAERGER